MDIFNKLHKVHYAWLVAIGCCLLFFYGVGMTTGTYAIFLPQIINELNLTNTEAASIFSIISITGLILMIVVDKISNLIGLRLTILIASILIVIGNCVFAFSYSLTYYYIASALIGVGYGCCSPVTIAILINRWFAKSKGTAIGLAFSGSGIATIILSPVLSEIIISHGMRVAFLTQSIIIMTLSILTFYLIRNYPKDKNISRYGEIFEVKEIYDNEAIEEKINSRTSKLFTWQTILIIAVALFLGMTIQPLVSHLPSFLMSLGYSQSAAMSVLSIYGLSMIIWKNFYGIVIDRLGAKTTSNIFFPLWILNILFSWLINKNIILVYINLLFIGIGPAIATVSLPIWAHDIYNVKIANKITVIIQVIAIGGSSIGMTIIGYFLDLSGSYNVPLFIIITLSLFSFVLIRILYLSKNKDTCSNQL